MFKIIVQDAEIRAAFARLRQATDDQRSAMSDIGEAQLRRIDNRFRTERDPYNVPWVALSTRTLKRKQKNRKILKVLQETGLFRASFSYTADRNSVEIGSNRVSASGAPLGLFHQLGTKRMSARPILPDPERGLPPQDLQEVLTIIGDHVENAW